MNILKRLGLVAAIFAALVTPQMAEAATAWNAVVHAGSGGSEIGQVISAGAPGTAETGATSETVLANILIPAGMAGPNARITVRTFWNFTGTAGTKTVKVYLNTAATAGGTAYLSAAGASGDLSAFYETTIVAQGSTSAQIGGLATGTWGRSTAAVLPSGTIDMTAASYIVISATLANSADTATLAGYQVEILK